MLRINIKNKFRLFLITGLMFFMASNSVIVWAWTRSLPPRHQVVEARGRRYHYHEGRFYRRPWFGFGFSVVTPPIGTVVTEIPHRYRTIRYGGIPYYYYDNIYYTEGSGGYYVVPEPVPNMDVEAEPAAPQSQTLPAGTTITINIPNSNGGFTPVVLTKHNSGYIGPQGEYYSVNPTVEQLKALYGK